MHNLTETENQKRFHYYKTCIRCRPIAWHANI